MNLYPTLIAHGVGVALSPLPIAALIFLLLSNKPKTNSLGFLTGWFLALVVNVFIFAFLLDASGVKQGGDPIGVRIFHLILGLLLICIAFKEWKGRPTKGKAPKVPKWMKEIASFNFIKSFLIAVALVTVNAKNTVLDVAVGATIAHESSSVSSALVAIIVFSCIASLSILLPVLAFLMFGHRLKKPLNSVNGFFVQNSNVILCVLFLILGVSLLLKVFS